MIKRKAFTLFEIILVIVILGIVSGMGMDIIINLYNNYIRANAVNRLQGQSEIALEQIAKRMQYRIKDSTRAFKTNADGTLQGDIVQITDADSNQTAIEWIGYSNESFLGGWSGFLDMDSPATSSATNRLSTPDSNLTYANIIIKALTNNGVAMDGTAGADLPALIFKGAKTPFDVNNYYNPGNDGNYTLKVEMNTTDTFEFTPSLNNVILDFDRDGNPDIFEQYYLSHTAYAIVPIGNANDFNLTLYYNYQPWEGEDYENHGTPAVLAEHVSTFQFLQQGSTLRLKICIHDNNRSSMLGIDFATCKEEVVF